MDYFTLFQSTVAVSRIEDSEIQKKTFILLHTYSFFSENNGLMYLNLTCQMDESKTSR